MKNKTVLLLLLLFACTLTKAQKKSNQDSLLIRDKGWTSELSFAYIKSSETNEQTKGNITQPQTVSALLINGYRYKKISLGLGFGIENWEHLLMPVFGDFKLYGKKRKREQFYLFLRGGSGFPLQKWVADNSSESIKVKGMFACGIGFQHTFPGRRFIAANIGYRYMEHEAKYKQNWDIATYTTNYSHNRLEISLIFGII